jgi:hypothetical protein
MEIVAATMDHARAIRLRPGDAMEVCALGETQESALGKTLARAVSADTYLIDGEPVAIAGIVLPSLLSGVASPFLMTGEPVERHRKSFMEHTRVRVEGWRLHYDVLVSYVHADYARAIRWLRWLGFEIGPVRSIGPLDAPFHEAILRGRT